MYSRELAKRKVKENLNYSTLKFLFISVKTNNKQSTLLIGNCIFLVPSQLAHLNQPRLVPLDNTIDHFIHFTNTPNTRFLRVFYTHYTNALTLLLSPAK